MCPPWGHIGATWRTIELVHPSANSKSNPQHKRQIDRFSRFLHSSQQKVHILYSGRPYPPELPFPLGYLDPRLASQSNTWCLGPMQAHNPNGTSIGSAVYAQVTAECPYTLQWFACFPQNWPFAMGIWTPCNTWFLGPTRVLNPNGNSIALAVLQGSLVWQTTLLGR